MKLLIGFLAAFLLVVLGTTVDAQAQVYYVSNSSTVTTASVSIQTSCGPVGPFVVPPGPALAIPIPPGCTVLGILYNGGFFPVGYSGPVPPPTPPNRLQVTPLRAVFF
jgi:hypothetical protein